MDYFEIKNAKDTLNKSLILSKPLTNYDAKQLNLSNTYFEDEEENFLPKQWFCSMTIAQWEGVGKFVQGDSEKPYANIYRKRVKLLMPIWINQDWSSLLNNHLKSSFLMTFGVAIVVGGLRNLKDNSIV
ncbi:hypothetical protein ACIP9C_03530 [Lysinibacillus sp. NPDC093210]|uniref:hypothetical protein n=1 Tax=Lysinibacillus sp. NPDC093210 TaxID=3364133 RepID=UPI003801C3AA